MKLHYRAISSSLLRVLQKLMLMPSLRDFALVGGTNLALQSGHRKSIDIDLFTDKDRTLIDRHAIMNDLKSSFAVCQGSEAMALDEIGYHLFIGDSDNELLKLDLWFVDPFVFPLSTVDGIRMADIREIAAFKLMAATQENRRQKDFWDIYELLDKFSLSEMIGFAERRYPYSFNKNQLLHSLATAGSVELAPEGIDCFRGRYWELIVLDLSKEADAYISSQKD